MSLVEKLAEKKEELALWKNERKKLMGKKELGKGRGGSEFSSKWDLPHISANIRQLENEIALIEFSNSTGGGC